MRDYITSGMVGRWGQLNENSLLEKKTQKGIRRTRVTVD